MHIPTEPIGSIPRPPELIEAIARAADGTDPDLDPLYDEAIRNTIERFELTGSPVITDGEQRKYHNFWTYSVHGLPNTATDGFRIPFSAGHVRRMPRLTAAPFRYRRYRDSTHSADADYAVLLPSLFQLSVRNFYVALAREPDRIRVLEMIRGLLKPHHRVFVGVISPIDPNPRAWLLRPVSKAARVGEQRAVTWKRLYLRPCSATRV